MWSQINAKAKLIKKLGVGSRGDHPPGSKVEEDAIAAAGPGSVDEEGQTRLNFTPSRRKGVFIRVLCFWVVP